MKAFLLAAGYGTRLRPLTDATPKCLVPIRGKPLLGWWFDLLRHHRVSGVLINTHYLAAQVESFTVQYSADHPEFYIQTVYEPELLGSGGTIWTNRGFVQGETSFLICYADNLTDIDLTAMARFHSGHTAPLTMALFHAPEPSQCGIATMDDTGLIAEFTEKPEHPNSDLANAGIYLARQDIFDVFPGNLPIDIGFDILPRLAGKMYGWPVEGFHLDVGTPDTYQRAQEEWPHDHF